MYSCKLLNINEEYSDHYLTAAFITVIYPVIIMTLGLKIRYFQKLKRSEQQCDVSS